MKKKIFNVALISFIILFFLYPLRFGLPTTTKTIITLITVFLILKYVWPKIKRIIKINEKYYLFIIIVLFLITRIVSLIVLKDNIIQISDFDAALNVAKNMDFGTLYYRNFVHWIFMPVIHHYLLGIFGITQTTIMAFNIFITLGITIGIYKVTQELTKNNNTSFIAALIYTIWPANIIYIGINTPEHIGSLLLVIGAYFILKIFDIKVIEKGIIYSLIVGIILGISVFFKNFALVFIIAFIIYVFMYFLKNKFKLKELRDFLVYILTIFLTYSAVTTGMYNIADRLVGEEVNRSIAPCYMLVGLHSTSEGNYNVDLYKEYFDTIEEYGYEKGNKIILKKLAKDIKNNDGFIDLLDKKAISLHSNDVRVNWVEISAISNNSNAFADFLRNTYDKHNYYFFTNIILFMVISLIALIKKKDLKLLFISLIIFGATLMLMLVESQARYTYAILPFYTILASVGLIEYNKITISKKNT